MLVQYILPDITQKVPIGTTLIKHIAYTLSTIVDINQPSIGGQADFPVRLSIHQR